MKRSISAAILLLLCLTGTAGIKLPSIFGDNMVIQRNSYFPIWGTATPNRKVSVVFANEMVSTFSDEKGHWEVKLSPTGPSNVPRPIHISDTVDRIQIKDVLVGDLWVCAGEAGANLPVSDCLNADNELKNARRSGIRFFRAKPQVSETPMTHIDGAWDKCSPETAANFSALGYFFARDVRDAYLVPVGVILLTKADSVAESWISKETMWAKDNRSDFIIIHAKWRRYLKDYSALMLQYPAKVTAWEEGGRKGERPIPPKGPNDPERPAFLYNGMINPLVKVPIEGVLWFQGRSNADRYEEYRKLFAELIKDWRTKWNEPKMPFIFVQLPPVAEMPDEQLRKDWPYMREAQSLSLQLPATAMVTTTDLGSSNPKDANQPIIRNMQKVAKRAFFAAEKLVYGKEDMVIAGPTFIKLDVKGAKAILTFDNVGSGLALRPGTKELKGFIIAGKDGKFYWAKGAIDGKDKVVVFSPKVKAPTAVRYNWGADPEGNLYNEERLPALPFRTDGAPKLDLGKKEKK